MQRPHKGFFHGPAAPVFLPDILCAFLQHGAQHVKQPRPPSVTDGFVSLGKVRRKQAASQGYGPGIFERAAVFILFNQIPTILLHDLAEGRRVFFLQHHQGAVICQTFGKPLVTIGSPYNQVSPPLVCGFVRRDLSPD